MNRIFATVLLLLGVCILSAQSVSTLKKKRQKNKKELEYTSKILKTVRKKQNSSLAVFNALQQDIQKREKNLKKYRSELHQYEKKIEEAKLQFSALKDQEVQLKNLYGELLNKDYETSGRFEKWLYIFSAEDFSKAYNRYKYYEQFNQHIKAQLTHLETLQDSLNKKAFKIKKLKKEKEKILSKSKKEKELLAHRKSEAEGELKRLRSKEKELLSILKTQQKRERNLQKKIKELIVKRLKKTHKQKIKSPTDTKLSKTFAQNKGKLPWPTKGYVSSHFGEHKHPILKRVKVRNDGIDIITKKGSVCRAIFNGEVSQILSIAGLNSTVIVKHGIYLSVYANLSNLRVKKGDKVQTGEQLGKVATSLEGETLLKLQIWKDTSRQNPLIWLKK